MKEGDLRVETLCENEWVSLKKMVYTDVGINGYTYSHETACKGKKVAIMPFRMVPESLNPVEILLREEVTPCWHPTKQMLSSITGGCEDNSTPEQDAVRELSEEAGYDISVEELISLGTMFSIKSADTVYHLYTVDLTGKDMGEASGDGSELESRACCVWKKSPMGAQDPFVYSMWVKAFYHNNEVKEILGVS
jgi:ADP-ribose pyrophosphatase YjhB (NUDIX family)